MRRLAPSTRWRRRGTCDALRPLEGVQEGQAGALRPLHGRGRVRAGEQRVGIRLPPRDGAAARYARRLRALPVGHSDWAVHSGPDTAELRALVASGAGWEVRRTDLDVLVSPEARELVRAAGIIRMGYRPLQARWRRGASSARAPP
jgi:hypothetical protein